MKTIPEIIKKLENIKDISEIENIISFLKYGYNYPDPKFDEVYNNINAKLERRWGDML